MLKFWGRDYSQKFKYPEIKRCRFECLCACTGIMFFVPLVSIPESRYGRYWANQGLLILLIELICLLVGLVVGGIFGLLSLIPFVGVVFGVIETAVTVLLSLIPAAYIIISLVYVSKGKARDIPFVGFVRIIK